MFYRVLQGFTGFYWVLLGFTGFDWVLADFRPTVGAIGSYLKLNWSRRGAHFDANRTLTNGGGDAAATRRWIKVNWRYLWSLYRRRPSLRGLFFFFWRLRSLPPPLPPASVFSAFFNPKNRISHVNVIRLYLITLIDRLSLAFRVFGPHWLAVKPNLIGYL